mmetsp:Transcript_18400/g.42627  ORF Transcript_18400/g.42627 Transcript_18400/m.42627 type:complete len:128 (-) Transcript_18400:191-574(-)
MTSFSRGVDVFISSVVVSDGEHDVQHLVAGKLQSSADSVNSPMPLGSYDTTNEPPVAMSGDGSVIAYLAAKNGTTEINVFQATVRGSWILPVDSLPAQSGRMSFALDREAHLFAIGGDHKVDVFQRL